MHATDEIQRRDPTAVVLSLHADWWVGDAAGFRQCARQALAAATTHDALVTVGIVPTRPDTSYGYIEPGAALDDGVTAVLRFTEKPNAVRAAQLVQQGALWNSGLFAWTPVLLLAVLGLLVVCVAGRFEWDDVGTWAALQRVREPDAGRNVLVGRAWARQSVDTTVWADDGVIVVDGVKGLVVVRANGITLVTTRERAADLKELLAELPESVRDGLPS